MTPKKKRPMGRLPQLSKRARLTRRSCGQWVAEVQVSPRRELALRNHEWSEWK